MEPLKKYLLIDVFADNGEHSHYALIERSTGVKVWSEDPKECKAQGYPVNPLKHNTKSLEEIEQWLKDHHFDNRAVWLGPRREDNGKCSVTLSEAISMYASSITQQVEELTREVETRRDAMVNYMALMDKKEEENKALKSELEELKKERETAFKEGKLDAFRSLIGWADPEIDQLLKNKIEKLEAALNSPAKQGD